MRYCFHLLPPSQQALGSPATRIVYLVTSIRASLVSRSALESLAMIPLMTKKRTAAMMPDAREDGQSARALEWVGELLTSDSLERGEAFLGWYYRAEAPHSPA